MILQAWRRGGFQNSASCQAASQAAKSINIDQQVEISAHRLKRMHKIAFSSFLSCTETGHQLLPHQFSLASASGSITSNMTTRYLVCVPLALAIEPVKALWEADDRSKAALHTFRPCHRLQVGQAAGGSCSHRNKIAKVPCHLPLRYLRL